MLVFSLKSGSQGVADEHVISNNPFVMFTNVTVIDVKKDTEIIFYRENEILDESFCFYPSQPIKMLTVIPDDIKYIACVSEEIAEVIDKRIAKEREKQ